MLNSGMARTWGCWPLQNVKDKNWLLQDYFFGLVIQDHIESLRKANTIKRGWGIVDEVVAHVLSDIAPKTLKHLLKNTSDQKPKSSFRSHRYHLLWTHRDDHSIATAKTLVIRSNRNGSQSHRDGQTKFLWWCWLTSELPRWTDRNYQDEVMP